MTDAILQFVNGIPAELAVLLLAFAPIVELRAALPVALGVYQMPLIKAFPLVILGNMLPALLIIYGWGALVDYVSKHWPWLSRQMDKWYQKTQGQWDKKIEKYGPWALILFVAIPLPGSGVWSGSLAAWIFGINKRNALLAILAGAILSGVVVTILTYGGISLVNS